MNKMKTIPVILIAALAVPSFVQAELEEITVTARKKSEDLQDVPLQVSVLGEDELTRLGVRSLPDIVRLTPSLDFDTGFSPQDTRIVIRGLSPTRGRQNAAVLQDGIDISSESTRTAGGSLLINPRLFDLQRVEVVKGPQNALYGRSAFNGAINYVTKRPETEVVGFGGIDIGEYQRQELRGGISGGITDQFAVGLAGATWNRDGFYTNPLTGGELGGGSGAAGALSAVFRPSDTLEFYLRLETTDDDFDVAAEGTVEPFDPLPVVASALSTTTGLPGGAVLQGAAALSEINAVTGVIQSSGDLPILIGQDPRTGLDFSGTERKISRGSLIVDWDIRDNLQISSLSHMARSEVFQFHDGNRQGPITGRNLPSMPFGAGTETWFDNTTDLLSQEIRLSSSGNDRVDWTAGLQYWREDSEMLDGSIVCLLSDCLPILGGISASGDAAPQDGLQGRFPDIWNRKTRHWSVYGLTEIGLTDEWSVILEGRYIDEQVDVEGPQYQFFLIFGLDAGSANGFPPGGPGIPYQTPSLFGKRSDSYFLPKATVQWQREDVLVYATASQSRKPGGFSTLTGGVGAFNPERAEFSEEKLTVYELGTKSLFFDKRVRFNGAVFFQDFTDKQTTTQVLENNIAVARPVNDASAEVLGLEFDATWSINDYVTAGLGYTFLDTKYDDYTVLTDNPVTIAEAGNCAPEDLGGESFCRVSYTGNELEGAARNSAVARLDIRMPFVRDLDWFAGAQGTYRDKRYISDSNIAQLDSYFELDAQVGVGGDNWEAVIYVENMLDDDTPRSSLATAAPLSPPNATTPPREQAIPQLQVVSLNKPQLFGARFNIRF